MVRKQLEMACLALGFQPCDDDTDDDLRLVLIKLSL